MNGRLAWTTAAFALALWGQAASGQSFSSGSTGADAIFAPTASQNITVRPGGVYHYTTVNIPAGVTVRYFRNTDNAPVVILATGDVTIAGSLLVDGSDGALPGASTIGANIGGSGGPGGFRGGNGGFSGGSNPAAAIPPTAGQGPGGGAPSTGSGGHGGTYAAPTSFVSLTPLFGGSGGGGGIGANGSFNAQSGGSGGGGGGGALIASSTRIIVNGLIRANGGSWFFNNGVGCQGQAAPGTGGAIRLVTPEIIGAGSVQATRGLGGCAGTTVASDGRIRMEAITTSGFTGTTAPTPSIVNSPGPVSPGGNPALANVPALAITSVGGVAVPVSPAASYFAPDLALAPGTANPVPVVVTAANTPVGSPTLITVRLVPQSPGAATTVTVPAASHSGSFASSTATANVTLAAGQVTVLQASAAMTLTGQTASLFPLIDGEPVERVMVAAVQGQPSTLSLVTKSGKEVPLDQLRLEDQIRVAQAWEAMNSTRSE